MSDRTKGLKSNLIKRKEDKKWTKCTSLHFDYGFMFTRSPRGQRAVELDWKQYFNDEGSISFRLVNDYKQQEVTASQPGLQVSSTKSHMYFFISGC